MPIRKPKKKVRYIDRAKAENTLEVLGGRALISLTNYLEYDIDERAHKSMEQLFRDYKKSKKEVHQALLDAFKFLLKEQYIPDPEFPEYPPELGPPPSKKVVKAVKKHINRIARKVWKK
jgi:hypothetical protein